MGGPLFHPTVVLVIISTSRSRIDSICIAFHLGDRFIRIGLYPMQQLYYLGCLLVLHNHTLMASLGILLESTVPGPQSNG